jgi:hypothetical protein
VSDNWEFEKYMGENIKIYHREIEHEAVKWIQLAQGEHFLCDPVNMITNFGLA